VADLKQGPNPYSSRSKTAHGTATHGIETIYGYLHLLLYEHPQPGLPFTISMDYDDHTQRFMWREVPAIRAVASDLLLAALSPP
jgi:hypothetical protein